MENDNWKRHLDVDEIRLQLLHLHMLMSEAVDEGLQYPGDLRGVVYLLENITFVLENTDLNFMASSQNLSAIAKVRPFPERKRKFIYCLFFCLFVCLYFFVT